MVTHLSSLASILLLGDLCASTIENVVTKMPFILLQTNCEFNLYFTCNTLCIALSIARQGRVQES